MLLLPSQFISHHKRSKAGSLKIMHCSYISVTKITQKGEALIKDLRHFCFNWWSNFCNVLIMHSMALFEIVLPIDPFHIVKSFIINFDLTGLSTVQQQPLPHLLTWQLQKPTRVTPTHRFPSQWPFTASWIQLFSLLLASVLWSTTLYHQVFLSSIFTK